MGKSSKILHINLLTPEHSNLSGDDNSNPSTKEVIKCLEAIYAFLHKGDEAVLKKLKSGHINVVVINCKQGQNRSARTAFYLFAMLCHKWSLRRDTLLGEEMLSAAWQRP